MYDDADFQSAVMLINRTDWPLMSVPVISPHFDALRFPLLLPYGTAISNVLSKSFKNLFLRLLIFEIFEIFGSAKAHLGGGEEREGCNTAFERHGIESVRRADRSQNLAARTVAPGDGVIYPNRRHIFEAKHIRVDHEKAISCTTDDRRVMASDLHACMMTHNHVHTVRSTT